MCFLNLCVTNKFEALYYAILKEASDIHCYKPDQNFGHGPLSRFKNTTFHSLDVSNIRWVGIGNSTLLGLTDSV
jgi:hypothetical protein